MSDEDRGRVLFEVVLYTAIALAIGSVLAWWEWSNFNECRAAGFSVLYCLK